MVAFPVIDDDIIFIEVSCTEMPEIWHYDKRFLTKVEKVGLNTSYFLIKTMNRKARRRSSPASEFL